MFKSGSLRVKIFLALGFCLAAALPALAEAQAPQSPDAGLQTYFSTSPKSVTLLYRDSGEIHEEFALNKGREGEKELELIIYLPGTADPQTLSLNFAGGRVLSFNSENMPPGEEDPFLAPLRAKVEAAKAESQNLEGRLAAVQARINAWNNTPAPTANIVAELERLDAARQKYIPALSIEAAELGRQLEKAKERQNWLEGELSGHPASIRVRVALLREKAGDAVNYSYIMGNCGWNPVYRLEAAPDQKSVRFAMNAEFWQKSGFDWKNTPLSLSTMQPGLGLSPSELYPWDIGPMEKLAGDRKEMMLAKVTSDSGTPAPASGPTRESMSYAPPEEEQRATYALWNLGTKTLSSGRSSSVTLLEENWTAKFSVTVRPWTDDQGYLTAEIDKSKTARGLPAGDAIYLVDGTSVGQGRFSPLSDEPIFFGADPMVSSEMTLLNSKSDEAGIINKDQTLTWDWNITIHNKRKVEIPVRVEDSMPEVRDGRITLAMDSNPAPKTDAEKHTYFWEKTLAPGSDWLISHKLKMTAPADLPVLSTR